MFEIVILFVGFYSLLIKIFPPLGFLPRFFGGGFSFGGSFDNAVFLGLRPLFLGVLFSEISIIQKIVEMI